tara:strand:+ start:602 stop:859 length:258 start_codon:yes stop_codon:yes gene_type:complete
MLSEQTKINLSPKNFVFIICLVATFVGTYYSLQAQIEEAKRLPPRDSDVDTAIVKTHQQLDFIQTDIFEIKERIQIMEERLYKLQ